MTYLKQVSRTANISAQPRNTMGMGAQLWSYDKNVSKFVFDVRSQNREVIDLKNATVRVLLQYDKDGKQANFIDTGVVENADSQTVSYTINPLMRGYVGTVLLSLYIDLASGEQIDVTSLSFTMSKSLIDDAISQVPDFYIADLEKEVSTIKTELSSETVKAKSDIATTVKSVQDLGLDESTKIQAVLPTLQTQISDTQANAQAIKNQLEAGTALAGIKTAWANSADGVTDFTNVKPETNMYDETNLHFFWNNGNGTYFTDKTSYPYVTTVKAKTEGVSFNISISNNDANVNVIGEIYTIYFEYRGNLEAFFVENGKILYKNADFSKTYEDWTQVRIIFKAIDGGNGERFSTSSVDGFQVRKIKFGHADKLSVYTSHPNYNLEHSFLKYKGISNIDSTNPNDYKWSQSDEYRDYKEDKLTQAIIALGGTV